MQVIKKDGRLQEFQLEKVAISMSRASDDIEEPLNESDVHVLSDKINKVIHENYKEKIMFSDIRKIVVDTLIEMGFSDVAESYKKDAPK